MTSSSNIEEKDVDVNGFLPIQEPPFFLTARFWKRFSVYISVTLSILSLVISSMASLKPGNAGHLKALTVTSIVINCLSVALSALTSLDWQSQAVTDRRFAQMLSQISHVHEGREGRIVVVLGRGEGMQRNEGLEGVERVGKDGERREVMELENRKGE
ncbi:hypothetical protein MFRU_018g00780 [Monilinia fructicola]|uniref:SMODS and SLOG-associating 2TM effector domain-containing protein n=1 Tax=Monilinia fructicola TaxID=38448 RepID=A0A5M9JW86_MONFR|nr:hypothetical protein EYC84_001978 [Monilinia fructicola]KAG4028970.1 hypothetical protein MFRU_018g00780 [Monilinia fructicola]